MNNTELMLSVIIPMYNAENTIIRCLESIFEIQNIEFEVIVVDDGSLDKGLALCEKQQTVRKNLKIIKQKNSGPSAARNNAIKQSRGKYIMFIDSDDWINWFELDKLINQININDYDTVMYNTYRFDKKNKRYYKDRFKSEFSYGTKEYLYTALVTTYDLNCIWNNLYSSQIIKENNLYFNENVKNGEDLLFNTKYFEKSNKGIYLDYKIYNYSSNSQGITNTFFIEKFDDVDKTYTERMRIIKKYLNNDIHIVTNVNKNYVKVLFKYIALSKKSGIKDDVIEKKINNSNLYKIIQKYSDDLLATKLLKFMMRKKMYNVIKIIYEFL